MTAKKKGKRKGPSNAKAARWFEAQKRCKLSHREVSMARQLGLNPKKLQATPRNHGWKAPTAVWIRDLFLERFGPVEPSAHWPPGKKPKKKKGKGNAEGAGVPPPVADEHESWTIDPLSGEFVRAQPTPPWSWDGLDDTPF